MIMRNELPCWGCLNVIYFNKWHWIYLKLTTMKEEWKVLKFSWNNNRTAKQGTLRDGSEWQLWLQAPGEGWLGRMLPEAPERLQRRGEWEYHRESTGLASEPSFPLSFIMLSCAHRSAHAYTGVWAGMCMQVSKSGAISSPLDYIS